MTDEARRTRAMLEVLGARVREAERALGEARATFAEAERYRGVCRRDLDAESARLRAIIAHLRSPEVSSSAPRYAEMLATRDIVARDLGRERFMFDNAAGALEAARAALAERRDALARLRARADALRERLTTLRKGRDGRLALAAENEAEELAALRHALPGGPRR